MGFGRRFGCVGGIRFGEANDRWGRDRHEQRRSDIDGSVRDVPRAVATVAARAAMMASVSARDCGRTKRQEHDRR